jgi:hypothetical protein
MPTRSAAQNYTAQQVAEAGGADSIWTDLYDRLWDEHLLAVRDGRPYILQIKRLNPSLVLDSDPPQNTFAVRAYFCLADPFEADVGETVHASCMPPHDTDPGPPPQTIVGGRQFVRTDEGWERVE